MPNKAYLLPHLSRQRSSTPPPPLSADSDDDSDLETSKPPPLSADSDDSDLETSTPLPHSRFLLPMHQPRGSAPYRRKSCKPLPNDLPDLIEDSSDDDSDFDHDTPASQLHRDPTPSSTPVGHSLTPPTPTNPTMSTLTAALSHLLPRDGLLESLVADYTGHEADMATKVILSMVTEHPHTFLQQVGSQAPTPLQAKALITLLRTHRISNIDTILHHLNKCIPLTDHNPWIPELPHPQPDPNPAQLLSHLTTRALTLDQPNPRQPSVHPALFAKLTALRGCSSLIPTTEGTFADTPIGLQLEFPTPLDEQAFLTILRLPPADRQELLRVYLLKSAHLKLLKGRPSRHLEDMAYSRHPADGLSLVRVIHDLHFSSQGHAPAYPPTRPELLRQLSRVYTEGSPTNQTVCGDYILHASQSLHSNSTHIPDHLYPDPRVFAAVDRHLPRTLYEPVDHNWLTLTYSQRHRPIRKADSPCFTFKSLRSTINHCNYPVIRGNGVYFTMPAPSAVHEHTKLDQALQDLLQQVTRLAIEHIDQKVAFSDTDHLPLPPPAPMTTPSLPLSPIAPLNHIPPPPSTTSTLEDRRDAACIAKILLLQSLTATSKLRLSTRAIFTLEVLTSLDMTDTPSPTTPIPTMPDDSSQVPHSSPPSPYVTQAQREVEDYLQHECSWIDGHCHAPHPDLRPPLFPEDLWQYVPTSMKTGTAATETDPAYPSIAEEWSRYSPERLQELITALMAIDISKEDDGRILELPIIRAHTLAHLPAYGHIDPLNPPRFKGQKFKINLRDPHCPPVQSRPRKSHTIEQQSFRARVEDMLSRSLLQPSKSEWNSPVRMVADDQRIMTWINKHGSNAIAALYDPVYRHEVKTLYRLTGDFRQLNDLTKEEPHPLPLISQFLDSVKDVTRFSTGDIEDAFFTVDMDEDSRKYTAFHAPHGSVEYTVMAQGLKNAATFWARIIEQAFQTLQHLHIFVYQDDVVNHASQSLRQHLDTQSKIYRNLRKHDLVFKPTKAHLNYRRQKILGHVLSKDGRRPDPSLVSAITELGTPTTLTDVRKLLGLAQVTRDYVPGLSQLVQPIQRLVNKNIPDIKEA